MACKWARWPIAGTERHTWPHGGCIRKGVGMSQPRSLKQITVYAIEIGGLLVLVDRNGERISRAIQRNEIIGGRSEEILAKWQWAAVVKTMAASSQRCHQSHTNCPWARKADSLASSCRNRRRFRSPPLRGRQRFESYSTSTWRDACKRLSMQGANRVRRHRWNGWVRWSHTVANNHNKKRGGRYSYESYCNSETNHVAH